MKKLLGDPVPSTHRSRLMDNHNEELLQPSYRVRGESSRL